MNILQTLVHLCFQIVLASTATWLEDIGGANLLYRPSLLTTNASSLVICISRCSKTVKCKALTYNNGTRVCTCLDKKQSMVTRSGNRIWHCQFDGFTYNAKLDWYIRLVIDTNKTQADAESFYGTLHVRAGLAVVDTSEKLNYLIGLNDFLKDTSIFVGATDRGTEGVHLWSTGTTLTTNWLPGEPNSFNGEEDCVVVYNTGFNDFPCELKQHFVCELV